MWNFFSPSHRGLSQTPAGCPAIHLNSDTIYPGIAWVPLLTRSVPHACPPLLLQQQARVVTCASVRLAIIRGSHDPLLGFHSFATATHRTQRNILLTHQITILLQSILKYINKPNEEILRASSRTKQLPSPWSLGTGSVALGSILVPQSGNSLRPSFGFLRRLHYLGMSEYIIGH